jgi:hypothetical protein
MIFMQILPAISTIVCPGILRAAAGVQTGAGQVANQSVPLWKAAVGDSPKRNGSKFMIPLFRDKSSDRPQYFVFWRFRQKTATLFERKWGGAKIAEKAAQNHSRKELL